MSTITNLTQSQKRNLTKSKETKNLESTIATPFKTDFLTSEAKKNLLYLQNTFIKVSILWHFNLECHIYLETNALGYFINRVPS